MILVDEVDLFYTSGPPLFRSDTQFCSFTFCVYTTNKEHCVGPAKVVGFLLFSRFLVWYLALAVETVQRARCGLLGLERTFTAPAQGTSQWDGVLVAQNLLADAADELAAAEQPMRAAVVSTESWTALYASLSASALKFQRDLELNEVWRRGQFTREIPASE